MPNHDHTTVAYQRGEKRQDYASIYVCVSVDEPTALCDPADGRVLGWTLWNEALSHAGRSRMIVVNWHWFTTRYLPRLAVMPPAARIFAHSKRGIRIFHAELDAPHSALRTLNSFADWEYGHSPDKVAAALQKSKVWPEDRR